MENETDIPETSASYEAPSIEKVGSLADLTKLSSAPNGDQPASPGTAWSA